MPPIHGQSVWWPPIHMAVMPLSGPLRNSIIRDMKSVGLLVRTGAHVFQAGSDSTGNLFKLIHPSVMNMHHIIITQIASIHAGGHNLEQPLSQSSIGAARWRKKTVKQFDPISYYYHPMHSIVIDKAQGHCALGECLGKSD